VSELADKKQNLVDKALELFIVKSYKQRACRQYSLSVAKRFRLTIPGSTILPDFIPAATEAVEKSFRSNSFLKLP